MFEIYGSVLKKTLWCILIWNRFSWLFGKTNIKKQQKSYSRYYFVSSSTTHDVTSVTLATDGLDAFPKNDDNESEKSNYTWITCNDDG